MSLLSVFKQKPTPKMGLSIIFLAITVQLAVLAVEFSGAVWPIWFGKPLVLETRPIDPRSLFRGNFVRLNFEVNRLDRAITLPTNTLKVGSIAYVRLEETQGIWHPVELTATKPNTGDYMRGRIRQAYNDHYQLEYGIEAYFLPKKQALELQNKVRSYAQFEVFVTNSGKGRVNSVLCLDEECTIPQNF